MSRAAGISAFAYPGPEGTFTHQALSAYAPNASTRPAGTVDAALAAVRRGEADAAMVPIENSVEGGVSATMDALAHDESLHITGEHFLRISFVLAAAPGTALTDVRRLGTHPDAWAQVRRFVGSRLPSAVHVPTSSTAAGAAALAAGTATFEATVCAPIAAARHRLSVLAADIGDTNEAVTRFVLVRRRTTPPDPTGADKTTIAVFRCQDRAGALLEILGPVATRGINMTRIASRPTGTDMGAYYFSLDLEGHAEDERVGDALIALRRLGVEVRLLGSYPRAKRHEQPVHRPEGNPAGLNGPERPRRRGHADWPL